jgi:sugar O-acyltransferase (sialic acid O-acetyltransferase NeuD family)
LSAAKPIYIPLLNPNETEANLAALHVAEGDFVETGDVLCTLETTKSTADLQAESSGYVSAIQVQVGQLLAAGALFGYLAESPGYTPPAQEPAQSEDRTESVPVGLRITQPALALARQEQVNLERLPHNQLITESWLRAHLQREPAQSKLLPPESPIDSTAILVYGGGGHGKSLIDLLRSLGCYRLVGVVDDRLATGENVLGLPVLGGVEALPQLAAQGVRLAINAVGGIGNLAVRIKVFQSLAQAGFSFPSVIHPTAFIEASAVLAAGVQVFPHAYVGSASRVGFGAIINSGAIISHDCILGDYVNISPGAILAGEVKIGSGVLLGMGTTVNLGVAIGAGARIGNGATIKENVPPNTIVRAGTIWPA